VKSRVGWIALLLAGGPAYAGDDSITAQVELSSVEDVEKLALADLLEQPVTAASGYAVKPADSPTLVSTLDRETIDRFGYRTLRDALAGMRGVYVGNDRNYSYIGARGYGIPGDYNTRFALSIDNHLINDQVYGQAMLGLELALPMIAVERIELVRGGAWSVHGENALLGAVQVVTASGATRPGLHVMSTSRESAQLSTDASERPLAETRGEDVSASYGLLKNGVDLFVAGAYTYDPGMSAIYMPELAVTDEPCIDERGTAKMCDGVVNDVDGEEAGGGYLSLRTKHLALHVLASRRRKEVPTASFSSLIGSRVETLDDRLYADLTATKSTPKIDLVGQISADYWAYHGLYPYSMDTSAPDGVGRIDDRDGATARTVIGSLRGRYKWASLGEHVTDAEVAAGLEGRSAATTQFAFDALPDGDEYYYDRHDPSRLASAFGHAAARAFDHVVGFAAVRADHHVDDFGLVVNPQAGLVLDGGELGRVRASISRGYRPPNLYEKYFSTSTGLPPRDLAPERSTTRELSLERYLGQHMRLLVVGYQQNVTDLITVTPEVDGTGIFENRGGMKSYGVETELEGRWDRLSIYGTYSYAHTRTSEGDVPANSPSSLASVRAFAPFAKGRVDVGVESYFVGRRSAYDGTMIDALLTTNAVATVHDVVKSLDLTLGVTNVFDERSGDPGSEEHRQSTIPHDPRTAWLRLSVELDP
jgi:outer membrane receptor for ferrienterochelin and colicins